ncbi:MAG: hypothetical protein ACFCVD_05980 [Nodosilinea sp.]
MVHFPTSPLRSQCPALQFAVIALMVVPTAMLSPSAAAANEFGRCTSSLIDAGVEAEVASTACAQALHPEEVSSCVVNITGTTDIEPGQALSACGNDRRPDELATCVTSIHSALAIDNSADVLGNCRRSVLPVRYSDCVIGVSAAADLTTVDSMAECIAAGYRPVDVAPTFIYSE